MEQVVLVDKNDGVLGEMEKIQAHQMGVLHRAFSVFIFNENGEMLLQQRAKCKYHSGGLWTNACCGHPRPGEDVLEAAGRRLGEEMGFQTELTFKNKFIYKAALDNSLTEYELDYVMTGKYEGPIVPVPYEVEDYAWVSIKDLSDQVKTNPDRFTVWFKIILEQFF